MAADESAAASDEYCPRYLSIHLEVIVRVAQEWQVCIPPGDHGRGDRPEAAQRGVAPDNAAFVVRGILGGGFVVDLRGVTDNAGPVREPWRDVHHAGFAADTVAPTQVPKVGEHRQMSTATSHTPHATKRINFPWAQARVW